MEFQQKKESVLIKLIFKTGSMHILWNHSCSKYSSKVILLSIITLAVSLPT